MNRRFFIKRGTTVTVSRSIDGIFSPTRTNKDATFEESDLIERNGNLFFKIPASPQLGGVTKIICVAPNDIVILTADTERNLVASLKCKHGTIVLESDDCEFCNEELRRKLW